MITTYWFDTDIDEQFSGTPVVEIPVTGPGSANRLIVIPGICNSGRPDQTSESSIDIATLDLPILRPTGYIFTNYSLGEQDEWLNIVDENTELKQATFIALSGIAADDDTDVVFAIDSVRLKLGNGRRVIIVFTLGLLGDVTISRITYQVNLLIRKALPPAPKFDPSIFRSVPFEGSLRFL